MATQDQLLQALSGVIDPNTGKEATHAQRMLGSLFDNNPNTFTELNYKGLGTGAYLVFDFGKTKGVRLSGVEAMARPKFRDRLAGAVVEGSDDGETWTTLTEGAFTTEDWQHLKMKESGKSYRYLRIFNRNNWHCNVSELRFHGTLK